MRHNNWKCGIFCDISTSECGIFCDITTSRCGILCDTTTWKCGIFCDITFGNVGSFATPIACHVRRWGTWSFLVYLRHRLHLQLSDWICQLIADDCLASTVFLNGRLVVARIYPLVHQRWLRSQKSLTSREKFRRLFVQRSLAPISIIVEENCSAEQEYIYGILPPQDSKENNN